MFSAPVPGGGCVSGMRGVRGPDRSSDVCLCRPGLAATIRPGSHVGRRWRYGFVAAQLVRCVGFSHWNQSTHRGPPGDAGVFAVRRSMPHRASDWPSVTPLGFLQCGHHRYGVAGALVLSCAAYRLVGAHQLADPRSDHDGGYLVGDATHAGRSCVLAVARDSPRYAGLVVHLLDGIHGIQT